MQDALCDCCNGVSVAAALLAQVHLHEAHAKAVHPPQQIQQPPWTTHNPNSNVCTPLSTACTMTCTEGFIWCTCYHRRLEQSIQHDELRWNGP